MRARPSREVPLAPYLLCRSCSWGYCRAGRHGITTGHDLVFIRSPLVSASYASASALRFRWGLPSPHRQFSDEGSEKKRGKRDRKACQSGVQRTGGPGCTDMPREMLTLGDYECVKGGLLTTECVHLRMWRSELVIRARSLPKPAGSAVRRPASRRRATRSAGSPASSPTVHGVFQPASGRRHVLVAENSKAGHAPFRRHCGTLGNRLRPCTFSWRNLCRF